MTQRKWLAECHAWLDDPTSVQARVKDGDPWSSVADRFSPMDRPEWQWRIKPATITINGTELPKPMDAAGITQTSNRIRLITDDRQENFWWPARDDRDSVYAKLVEVLGS